MRLTCPHCEKQLAVADTAAGRTVACPACKGRFRAPQEEGEPDQEPRLQRRGVRQERDRDEEDTPRRRSRRSQEEAFEEEPEPEPRPRKKKRPRLRADADEEASGRRPFMGTCFILLGTVMFLGSLLNLFDKKTEPWLYGGFFLGPSLIWQGTTYFRG